MDNENSKANLPAKLPQVKSRRFDVDSLTEGDKRVAVARLQRRVLQALKSRFAELQATNSEFTARKLADRLGMDPAVIIRRLNGRVNMTMKSVAEMFLVLESEPEISYTAFGAQRVADCRQKHDCPEAIKRLIAYVVTSSDSPAASLGGDFDQHLVIQFAFKIGSSVGRDSLPVTSPLVEHQKHN